MQTVIDWIPGAPENPEKGSEWFGRTESGDIFSAKYGFKFFDDVLYTNKQQTYNSKEFAYHAPYQPPQNEDNICGATRKVVKAIKDWAKAHAESNVNWEGETDGTCSVDYQALIMHLDTLEACKAAGVYE